MSIGQLRLSARWATELLWQPPEEYICEIVEMLCVWNVSYCILLEIKLLLTSYYYWTVANNLQWNFNHNSYIFIQENVFENVIWKMVAGLSIDNWKQSFQACNFKNIFLKTWLKKEKWLPNFILGGSLINLCIICAYYMCQRKTWVAILSLPQCVNSLGPSDAIWRHRSGSTLTQVMACCLTAPSHYLNQCWLIIRKVFWHSSHGNFIRDTSSTIHWI